MAKKILKQAAPKVSVILSSYNHAKYIAQAIQSVLNQTFTDFELLIFDDGSSDNSREIIKSFQDPRIKTFLYEVNRGAKLALQECLNAAQGKYIAVHHSDDLWAADKLEKQVNFLDNHADYLVCFTWVEIIDENGDPYQLSEKNIYYGVFDQENRSREQWLHDLFFRGNCFCHPSIMLRNKKNVYQDLYGVSGLWQLPDYSAWVRLLFKSNLYVLPERLTLFRLRRQRQENTSAERPDTVIRSEMELYRVLKEYRRLTKPTEFLKIFPEAQAYVVGKNFLPQYALAKILQTSHGSARKLLALDILFDLLNDKDSAKKLNDWYGYSERDFVRDNAEFGILYPETEMKYIRATLYCDTGEGFSENNKTTSSVYVRADGGFFAEFSIRADKEIKNLRFDPTEGESISMKIISAQVNGKDIELKACQPFAEQNGYQIFFTNDPQYIFEYKGNGEIFVQIAGNISAEYDSLQILRNKNLQQENKIGNLNNQLKEKNNQLEEKNIQLEENILSIKNLNSQLEEKNNQLEEKILSVKNLNEQVGGLQWQLNEIYSSRGYKILQKYYALRDKILPRGSTRRLLIKNFVWCVLNPGKTLSLMTAENFAKAWQALKHGGLRQLVIRSDNKLNSPAVTEIEKNISEQFGNSWLAEKEKIFLPENIEIDILIPIYNAYDFTRKCIESVYKNTDLFFNLYLIDDCSPDEKISKLLEEIRGKEKPANLRELKILRNEENLGFIGTVNRGFKISKNNIVLLNTDTEVPPAWLSRLVKPLLDDKKVASVTPFSNSAEICSFPNFCQNNDLQEGLTVAELDEIFMRYGDDQPCEIPTGVGFCMLLRRECIEKFGAFDKIFGKGYGEENDWCRRTAAEGYKHLHIKNLFVWHKHGASFAEQKDKSKQQRLNENLAILNERYPDYNKLVQDYISKDPAGANRNFLKHCAAAKANANIKGVMFMNHSMGGGAKVYQDRLIATLKKDWRVYGMEPLADGKTLLVKNFSIGEEKIAVFDLNSIDEKIFKKLLQALKIDWIFVNQLLTYPVPKILNCISESKIPYTFFGHDFFAVCSQYQLLNYEGKYCNAETDFEKCSACLKKCRFPFTNAPTENISAWRKEFNKFLEGAKEIIVPSENTAEIFKKYYSAPITVREHEVNKNLKYTFEKNFAEEEILTVAVVGAIGNEKGSKIIYALAEYLEKNNLPIKLIVIGITNLQNSAYISENKKFQITGAYDNKEISNLLAKYKVAVVLIPSIWPETYSYTTTEAMSSGYPVMVFPLGAPADRVKIGGGWILEDVSEESVIKKLKHLLKNRNEILEQAEKLKH